MPEWIDLKTTMIAMDNEKFQCIKCQSKYVGDRLKDVQRLLHCKTKSPTPIQILGDENEFSFYTCPGNFFCYACMELVHAFVMYEKGALPHPGSLFDQPNKIIEAFNVIASHRHAKLERDLAKQKRESKSKMRPVRRGR